MRVPILMAIFVFLFSILIDAYIYADIKKSLKNHHRLASIYGFSSICLWIFLLVVLLIPRREATQSIAFTMWALYSYSTVYISKFIFVVFSLAGGIPKLWHSRSLKLGKYIGLPAALICFIAMWWGALITRHNIEVVNVDINSPKLPHAFDGYRMVQISDLHVGTWGNDTSFISKLVDSVNNQKPDVIFFTGDIVNRHTGELEPFVKTLSRLHAPDGVWSILGNHDYGDYIEWSSESEKEANLNLLKHLQPQMGWKMLNNQSDILARKGDTIRLIGVENWGEPPFHQYGKLKASYPSDSLNHTGLNDKNFKILLSHNPEHWRQEVTNISNIDLTLSGHTHAMQTEIKVGNWKWSPAVFRYPLWGGLYLGQNKNGELLQLYINIGAGEVGMPFRIGAVPEITVITLHKEPIPYSLKPVNK